jgi:predicted nuclease with RNAse H fold
MLDRVKPGFALTRAGAWLKVNWEERPLVATRTMEKAFTRFIGVDLGGGKGKKTALAVLERTRDGVTVTQLCPRAKEAPLYDDALISALLSRAENSVVCVDAPLTLPPCLRCTEPVCPGQRACVDAEVLTMRGFATPDPGTGRDLRRGKPVVTPYTQRATDLYLRSRGIRARETLGQAMGPVAARAAHLVRALGQRFRLNHNLVEVFPKATLELLGFREPYKKRVDRRIDILASLRDLSFGPGVWREQCRQSDHIFDAVVCAYTGYLRTRDSWQISATGCDPVDPRGWIWVPPEATQAPAATPKPASTGSAQNSSQLIEAERLRLR